MAVKTYTVSAKSREDILKFYEKLDLEGRPEYNQINYYVKGDAFIIEIDSNDHAEADVKIPAICQSELKEAPVVEVKPDKP